MSRDNLSVVLAERPVDDIIPGTTFHQKVTSAPKAEDLKDGQILVEVLYLSLDPAMRGWMSSTLFPFWSSSTTITAAGDRICCQASPFSSHKLTQDSCRRPIVH